MIALGPVLFYYFMAACVSAAVIVAARAAKLQDEVDKVRLTKEFNRKFASVARDFWVTCRAHFGVPAR